MIAWLLALLLVVGLAVPAGAQSVIVPSLSVTPITVGNGGTGLTSGTSGGVLGYTAAATLASSAALTANGVVLGGGAGATPTSSAAYTANGQLPIGNGASAPTIATLQASRDVVVANGAGSITLDTRRVGSGRLTFSSATLVQFCPYHGNQIYIPSTALAYAIPSGCTTAANTSVTVNGTGASNLAASTTYLVCLFDSGGTLTVDFKTSLTHSADTTTGIETCNSTSRVLIGMVRTNSSSQFEDDNTLRGVLSFFNRRGIGIVNNLTANRTTTSTTYVEINSEIRGNFVTWADEAVYVSTTGITSNNGAGAVDFSAIGFDGTNQENAATDEVGSNDGTMSIALTKNGLSEGFHYATLLGAVNANTGTWAGGTYTADTTARTITSLTIGIRG